MESIAAKPRIGTPRNPRLDSLGWYLDETAELLGFHPHEWQRLLNAVSMQIAPRDVIHEGVSTMKLNAQHVGCLVGRQSGKTAWSAARVTAQALLPHRRDIAQQMGLLRIAPQHIAYTAQRRINAVDRWREHIDFMQNSDVSTYIDDIRLGVGTECLTFVNGSTYRPLTPNKNGARGATLDLIIVDEALAHPLWLLGVLRPTMSQRHSAPGCIGSQFVVISNAGNEDSELLNHLQELGHEAVRHSNDSRVWLEWSMAPGADPVAQNTWSDTMPTLNQPNGISLDYIREECETMKLDDFMREYLCVRIPKSDQSLFDFERWKELRRDDIYVIGDLVIAIDITPDRQRASIVAASRNGNYIPVEVIESKEGVEWLVDRTVEIAERHSCPVIVDTGGPAAAMHLILEQRGIEVIPFAAKDVAISAACFYDNVRNGTIAHLNDYRLNDAVRSVVKRPIGERWAYARKGNVDISPLVAASFAVWGIDSGNVDKPTIYS
ncbi:MAG: hypothetical protein ABW007_01300 [Chitinophagaceae bacterium]